MVGTFGTEASAYPGILVGPSLGRQLPKSEATPWPPLVRRRWLPLFSLKSTQLCQDLFLDTANHL